MSVLGGRILYEDTENKSSVRATRFFLLCVPETKRDVTLLTPQSSPRNVPLNNSQNTAKWDICSLKTKYFLQDQHVTEVISTYLSEEYARACRQRKCFSPKQPEIKG